MNQMTTESHIEKMSFIEKIIANIKGNILGITLTPKEYYYLMFKCETLDDIDLIKSMTMEECKYYLECCWYFDIENTAKCQLAWMRNYRKFHRE